MNAMTVESKNPLLDSPALPPFADIRPAHVAPAIDALLLWVAQRRVGEKNIVLEDE